MSTFAHEEVSGEDYESGNELNEVNEVIALNATCEWKTCDTCRGLYPYWGVGEDERCAYCQRGKMAREWEEPYVIEIILPEA